MASSETIGGRGVGEKIAEWVSVTLGVAGVAYFVVVLMTGFSMDYMIDRNPVLVWSGVVGTAGTVAWHGWTIRCRDIYPGDKKAVPGAGIVPWLLVSGAVLWLFGVWADSTRLNRAAVNHGDLVPRDPPFWPIWLPSAAVVAVISLLYARRRGVLRWALWSLPLQALWWLSLVIAV